MLTDSADYTLGDGRIVAVTYQIVDLLDAVRAVRSRPERVIELPLATGQS